MSTWVSIGVYARWALAVEGRSPLVASERSSGGVEELGLRGIRCLRRRGGADGGRLPEIELMAETGRYNEVDCRSMAQVLAGLRENR